MYSKTPQVQCKLNFINSFVVYIYMNINKSPFFTPKFKAE